TCQRVRDGRCAQGAGSRTTGATAGRLTGDRRPTADQVEEHAVAEPERGPTAAYGVHSEVGRLRTVLVCEPGLAHRRLTPSNRADLLFDDVMWVDAARRDHRQFVAEMQARGIEVLELHDLLTATLDVPGAKA